MSDSSTVPPIPSPETPEAFKHGCVDCYREGVFNVTTGWSGTLGYSIDCPVHQWICRAAPCVHDGNQSAHVGVHPWCEHCTVPVRFCDRCKRMSDQDWRVDPLAQGWVEIVVESGTNLWYCPQCRGTDTAAAIER